MLGKVFKYELRSIGRIMLPLFGISIIASAAVRLMLSISERDNAIMSQVLKGISGIIVFIVMLSVFFTLSHIIKRFTASTVKHEAYLTFTLPVSIDTHIIAKTISGGLFLMLSTVVSIINVCIAGKGFYTIFGNFLDNVFSYNELSIGLKLSTVLTILFFLFGGYLTILLVFFASSSLATLVRGNHTVVTALMFVIIAVVQSIIKNIFMSVFAKNMPDYIYEFTFGPYKVLTLGDIWQAALPSIIFTAIFAAVCYFITTLIYKKRLNLH